MRLVLTPIETLPLIRPGDDLVDLLADALDDQGISVVDGDVLVLAQKIVSKAEGRIVDLREVSPSAPACELAEKAAKDPRLAELILQESVEILRIRPGLVVVEHRLGFVCANAGIDHSNIGPDGANTANEWALLLPVDPDASASRIRRGLEVRFSARLGVLVIDSHGRAWRLGTVGITIGISGMPGLLDLRGRPDLYGRELRNTEVGVADELAAGASLVMGQAAEARPAVHVRGFPHALREGSWRELARPQEEDLFR